MRSSRYVSTPPPAAVLAAQADPSADGYRRATVALVCADGEWPHCDWPARDDPYVGCLLHAPPPHRTLPDGKGEREAVDVVVLRCENPADAFPRLMSAMGDMSAAVVVVSPERDPERIVEVFRGGAGYLVEDDYCAVMLSGAVAAAKAGHAYLSPVASGALRKAAQHMAPPDVHAMARLRAKLSPREREIMELLSTGLGAREIGARLRLREKTVRNNLSNIYAKLDARGSVEAVLRWLGATPGIRV